MQSSGRTSAEKIVDHKIADRYFVVHKPYNMVSQFISSHNVRLLGALNFVFPEGTHAIGRLDKESEGLLLLTTNKRVTRLLFQSEIPHRRRYLVQLKKEVTAQALEQLATGVAIPIKNEQFYLSKTAESSVVEKPVALPELDHHPFVPLSASWIQLTLTEGKYHQVRKMMNAIDNRCLRLIRLSIEDIILGDLPPGGVREIQEGDFFDQLHITQY